MLLYPLILSDDVVSIIDWLLQNGLPPFYDTDTNKMYGRILHDPVHYPEDMSTNARDIIAALLQKDPTKRLGLSGAEEIRKCGFFAKIDWNKYGHVSRAEFARPLLRTLL